MTRLVKQVTELIERYGGSNVRHERNKHHKFKFDTPSGKTAMVVVAVSPSDSQHGMRNNEALIRKALR